MQRNSRKISVRERSCREGCLEKREKLLGLKRGCSILRLQVDRWGLTPFQARNFQAGAPADILTKQREILRCAQDDDAQLRWTSGAPISGPAGTACRTLHSRAVILLGWTGLLFRGNIRRCVAGLLPGLPWAPNSGCVW